APALYRCRDLQPATASAAARYRTGAQKVRGRGQVSDQGQQGRNHARAFRRFQGAAGRSGDGAHPEQGPGDDLRSWETQSDVTVRIPSNDHLILSLGERSLIRETESAD